MLATDILIRPFAPQQATPAEWAAFYDCVVRLTREDTPDDPPTPLAVWQAKLLNPVATENRCDWLAWQGDQVVGRAMAAVQLTGDNAHLADFWLGVRPEHRRAGIGRALLQPITAFAAAAGRRLLITWSTDRTPACAAFMERIGAHLAMETHTNQLRIADVDPALLQAWQDAAATRAPGFELGLWEGPYPEDALPMMIAVRAGINHAPRGDLELEDHIETAEEIRAQEAAHAARGLVRWTMYVRETATGAGAGYTEVFWTPDEPEMLYQEGTVVLPPYRGRGLGRWLKAAMLAKVLRDRPSVRLVRTGNADTNAAMLQINYDLGYRPYLAELVWQVPLAQVQAYLERNP